MASLLFLVNRAVIVFDAYRPLDQAGVLLLRAPSQKNPGDTQMPTTQRFGLKRHLKSRLASLDDSSYRLLHRFGLELYKCIMSRYPKGSAPTSACLTFIEDALSFALQLLEIDERERGHIPKRNFIGLARIFGHAHLTGQPLHFVSFASNAIDQTQRQLKEKRNYYALEGVHKWVRSFALALPFTSRYEVWLGDYYHGLTDHFQWGELWDKNISRLRSLTTAPVQLLTAVAYDLGKIHAEIEFIYGATITKAIERMRDRGTLYGFNVTDTKARYDASIYAAIGAWLERNYPNAIIMDVQMRIYPYQQPWYQLARESPLPLFRWPTP